MQQQQKFTKVWIDRNIICGIIFWRWTAVDDVGKPSSGLLWDLVTRWSWNLGCCHLLLFVIQCQHAFCFILVFLINSGTHWQLDYTYWVVPNCMSGIMSSVNQPVIITEQFGKICDFWPVWYGDRIAYSRYGLTRIQFQILINHSSEKYVNIIHRQSTTDCKHIDQIGGGGGRYCGV